MPITRLLALRQVQTWTCYASSIWSPGVSWACLRKDTRERAATGRPEGQFFGAERVSAPPAAFAVGACAGGGVYGRAFADQRQCAGWAGNVSAAGVCHP